MPHTDIFTGIFGDIADGEKLDKLKQVTSEFPFFSLGQYYLLKELPADHEDFRITAARTALHFNNSYLLNHRLLNSNEFITETPARIKNDETVQSVDNPTIKKETSEDQLIFEPLYTTDYFASQGIKLSDEVKPDDKLGKQLRSFTDWLKTMKKVHEQKLPDGNEQFDKTVQHIAEKSNKESEILTESMAEVFAAQGKIGRAREVYHKLSLLDPSKSAYFAAKIEQLKEK